MEIIDYPNYLILPNGKIWGNKTQGRKEGFKKSKPNQDGYLKLGLTNEKGEKKFFVHRLLAIHYIENPNNHTEIDHIDNNPLNNNFDNLRWCSRSINTMNRRIFKNNKSGFKNISYRNDSGSWKVSYLQYKKQKTFKSKIDAICYKYIIQLRIKANHF
tara:strand:+ start:3012 stop:3485 length:474 start_codon:yes stop_codon:yes gene_type:complete